MYDSNSVRFVMDRHVRSSLLKGTVLCLLSRNLSYISDNIARSNRSVRMPIRDFAENATSLV